MRDSYDKGNRVQLTGTVSMPANQNGFIAVQLDCGSEARVAIPNVGISILEESADPHDLHYPPNVDGSSRVLWLLEEILFHLKALKKEAE